MTLVGRRLTPHHRHETFSCNGSVTLCGEPSLSEHLPPGTPPACTTCSQPSVRFRIRVQPLTELVKELATPAIRFHRDPP